MRRTKRSWFRHGSTCDEFLHDGSGFERGKLYIFRLPHIYGIGLLKLSPNHGTLRLHNEDDDDDNTSSKHTHRPIFSVAACVNVRHASVMDIIFISETNDGKSCLCLFFRRMKLLATQSKYAIYTKALCMANNYHKYGI